MKTLLGIFSLFSSTVFCQVKFIPTYSNQQWIQYYNTFQLNEKYAILSDIGYRCNNSITNAKVALIRSGVYYSFSPATRIGVGYTNFDYFTDHKETKNENRFYAEYSYKNKFKAIKYDNRFRIEDRFFNTKTTNYSQIRFRYLLSLSKDIWKAKESDRKISIFQTNELFYTFDNKSKTNSLDQVRCILGTSFQANKNLSFQLSYNLQFNKKTNLLKTYEFTNVFWLTIRQTLGFISRYHFTHKKHSRTKI